MNVGVGYRNIYGTDVNVSVDPLRKEAELNLTFPVGPAERGRFVNAGFGYNAQTRAPSGYIRFGKRNVSENPKEARAQLGLDNPNRNEYDWGFTYNQPRFAGDALGITPGQIPPPVPPSNYPGY